MSYDNTDSGTLGRNKRKEKENQPDYAGQINVGGEDYWLSAWLKTNGETGEKFFSLAVRPKNPREEEAGQTEPAKQPEMNDDIPF